MAISAQDVKKLREQTGCGMMECKTALTDANGDFEQAVVLLREKGLAKAEKKAGRIAAEGAVVTYTDEAKKVSVMIEVNAETDFAAKNEKFVDFAKTCAKTVAEQDIKDLDALMNATPAGSDRTVDGMLKDLILVISENMKVRRFVKYEGTVVSYIHGGGRIGVMVKFDVTDEVAANAEFKEAAKDVAMQIAALNVPVLSEDTVPADRIATEKEIITAQIKNDPKSASKPDAIIEKMAVGRLNKFFKENCLLDQEFVKDSSMSVSKYLETVSKKIGGDIKIVDFVRFEKGEGLEKKEDNFADEVASMM